MMGLGPGMSQFEIGCVLGSDPRQNKRIQGFAGEREQRSDLVFTP